VLGAAAEEHYRKEARQRQKLGRGGKLSEQIPEASKGKAADQAAKAAGTNGQYVAEAK
jgi:hypothetical protein